MTDNASQTTNTHYIDGYQYTGDHLDFFPHAEGYVNVLDFSEFHYIYTYKDHLGNIRLKYTKDPGSNQTEILEENHYYPYGMTHKGYNASHLIFWQMPGTGIDLVEVTPLMGDKYKYGFGGMEYQEELALNHYDFGARNGVYPERSRGNPALGRWMNLDPLAEMMRRHSPYNYAFNNPVFFIDPDGMAPIAGALKSGLLVQDTNFLGTSDISGGTMGSTAHGGGSEIKVEVAGLNADTSAPTLSKQNDTAGTGMAMGDDGVENLSCGCPTPPCPDASSPYPSFIYPIYSPSSSSPYGDIPWVEGPDPNFGRYMDAANKVKDITGPIDSKIDSFSKEITKSHKYQRSKSALVNIDRADPYKLQTGAAGAIGAGATESQRNTTDSLTNMKNREKLYQKKDSIISAFINKN